MLQDVPVPQALQKISHDFGTSAMGEVRKRIQPSPLADLCVQILDLRAGIRTGVIEITEAIREVAIQMDKELAAWKSTLPPSWSYATVGTADTPAGQYFQGKRHVYSNPWTANVWNNWRTMRIVVNQIILQSEIWSDALEGVYDSTAVSHIHQLSTEICISAPNFIGSPRKHIGIVKY